MTDFRCGCRWHAGIGNLCRSLQVAHRSGQRLRETDALMQVERETLPQGHCAVDEPDHINKDFATFIHNPDARNNGYEPANSRYDAAGARG